MAAQVQHLALHLERVVAVAHQRLAQTLHQRLLETVETARRQVFRGHP
jgi:hypothetical protein